MRLFADHRWPGNIRELENVVEYCVNMADGALVTEDDLPAYFLDELHVRHEHSPSPLKDAETAAIRELLDRYGWDVKGKEKTAAELGVSLRTLYRKMKQSGLLK
jgi:transcriptional regulator of acetoin/glycerol metabolism